VYQPKERGDELGTGFLISVAQSMVVRHFGHWVTLHFSLATCGQYYKTLSLILHLNKPERLPMATFKVYSNQGTLTEREGSVQLTSPLRWLVL
jgi:hypothetical protein